MEDIPREKLAGIHSLFDLTGQTAVITGGSRGLGRGIALALAAAGVDIALVSRTRPDLEAVANEIQRLGRRGVPMTADVADEKQVEKMVNQVLEAFERIDILI